MKHIEANCPYCNKPVEIDVEAGTVEKKIKSSRETFTDALKKISEDKAKRKSQFEDMQKNISKKKKESDNLFKKGLDDIKEKGLGDKPIRDIDL